MPPLCQKTTSFEFDIMHPDANPLWIYYRASQRKIILFTTVHQITFLGSIGYNMLPCTRTTQINIVSNIKNTLPLSRTIRREISFRISATCESFSIEALLIWIKSATMSGLNGFSFRAYRIYLRRISSKPKPVWIRICSCYLKSNGTCTSRQKLS